MDNMQSRNQLSLSEALLNRLKDMKESRETTTRRIARFFLSLAAEGKTAFSFNDWKRSFNISKSASACDIRSALRMGLIEHRMGLPSFVTAANENVTSITSLLPQSAKVLPCPKR